ncbi:MAG TPA: DUF3108 domain-containing protein [Kofleriaceae bacterium]|nr:DUF3108 domain-containing protein [Kofleriaceae bacterium]
MNRLAFASLVAGAAALVSCGKPPGSTGATTPGAAAGQPAPDGKLHDGPPLVTPGEHMQYALSLRGIELATYDLSIGDLTDLGGKKAVVVQGHAKSIGIASMVASIDDRFTSWVDAATGHPLRFQTDEFASGSSTDIEHAVIEFAARDGDQIPVSFHVNDAATSPDSQKASQPVAWDYNAFLVALRGWEGPPGSKLELEVFRSRWMWHVEVTIEGQEQLVTRLGDFPALRIAGRTYKLDRKGARAASSEERQFTMWISDDDGRVPLQISATTDYGALDMAITDYQPGNGARLRP